MTQFSDECRKQCCWLAYERRASAVTCAAGRWAPTSPSSHVPVAHLCRSLVRYVGQRTGTRSRRCALAQRRAFARSACALCSIRRRAWCLPAGIRQRPREVVVWAGYGQSDNIARTELGQIDGSYDSVGTLLSLAHKSKRIDAKIDSDLEYRVYSDDTFDNETLGTLDASATIGVVPNRFTWLFQEDFGQGLQDAFAPVGPNNRESINVATTGPTVNLPLGARTDFEMRGQYSARRYEHSSNVDTSSTVYELALFREATPTAKFGLIANSNDIEYTEVDAPPYKIERYSLRYEKTLATGHVRAEGGSNEISSVDRKDREPLFNFEWVRSVTARSDLSITGGREFTDSSSVLANAPPARAPGQGRASWLRRIRSSTSR